ncbi:MAG: GIY-YIG nuclease family protein [Candidatus Margulisbacteria bacterium]|nr:GIY-YIG nuclease family protein [Candidatus Margulisiibacteriota bacterium]
MTKQYYIYLMTNSRNSVIYVGVTNDLMRRVNEHKEQLLEGFTKKYNINKLVYYEIFQNSREAIIREKQIKAGSRNKKNELINKVNPEWKDLFYDL